MIREEEQPIWARAPGLVAARMAMADWERSLGKEMERVRPFLVKCVGEFTATYPQPGSGLRLVVQRRGRMIIAFPHPEDLDPARDLILTERDVQLWRVDWGKAGQETVNGQWSMGDGKPKPETGSQKPGATDDRRTVCDAKAMQARECASHFEQTVSGTGGGGPRVRVSVTVDADGFCGGPHPSETTNRRDGLRSTNGEARSRSRLQPAHKRTWWQNARERYGREAGPLELDKWRAVAKIVITGAIAENRKPAKERHSDYVTPLMLERLLAKLNAPGASRTRIETEFAVTLRRYVTREEQKAATK